MRLNKKTVSLFVLCLFFAVAASYAKSSRKGIALGLQGGVSIVGTQIPGLSATFKLPQLPMVIGLGYNFSEAFSMGLSLDWWLYQSHLVGITHLYVGPGLGFVVKKDSFDFNIRIPVGLRIFPLKPLELFLELTPAIGLLPGPHFVPYAAAGFRFWF